MTNTRTRRADPHAQRGSYLLEALIAVLIVALGILGLVGLQARMVQNVDDAQYRAEAAHLAGDALGRMWTSPQATLIADFQTGGGAGTPYDDFKTLVHRRLPGASAIANNPDVVVAVRNGDPTYGYDVTIVVRWLAPGEPSGTTPHNYTTTAVVRRN